MHLYKGDDVFMFSRFGQWFGNGWMGIAELLLTVLCVFFSLSIHEFGHAIVAYKLGDLSVFVRLWLGKSRAGKPKKFQAGQNQVRNGNYLSGRSCQQPSGLLCLLSYIQYNFQRFRRSSAEPHGIFGAWPDNKNACNTYFYEHRSCGIQSADQSSRLQRSYA